MEYRTHKPVPIFEVDKIVQKFQKQQQEKSGGKKDGFDIWYLSVFNKGCIFILNKINVLCENFCLII